MYKKYLVSSCLGIGVGILTLLGQQTLPIELNFLANSGSIWLIPSFIMGYYFRKDLKSSILLSVFCLLGCVYGYFIFEAIHNGHAFSFNQGALYWSVFALGAGVLFGIAAYYTKENKGFLTALCRNAIPAVFTAEGLMHLMHIAEYRHMMPAIYIKIAFGILLFIWINRNSLKKIESYIAYLLMSGIGFLLYEILFFMI